MLNVVYSTDSLPLLTKSMRKVIWQLLLLELYQHTSIPHDDCNGQCHCSF